MDETLSSQRFVLCSSGGSSSGGSSGGSCSGSSSSGGSSSGGSGSSSGGSSVRYKTTASLSAVELTDTRDG